MAPRDTVQKCSDLQDVAVEENVEAATLKHIKYIAESKAGLDREYSFTNRGGSAWGHRSGEERNSISQVLWTVAVTIVLAVVLHPAMGFLSHLTIVLEDDNEAMFEEHSSQPENSGNAFIQRCLEDPSGSYQEHGGVTPSL
ncbi:PREDICTED: uncharacterized protein LOC107354910 [Acropora digitifera]|uniref:uncharacterized protein LOC107354910 n=1 Tax=Acropora digitifera TaxID=70779 RepID=UPI00077A7FAE|nr:PREDICTED: uncharacterized protein LOC107354910 [Acropora digitifera]